MAQRVRADAEPRAAAFDVTRDEALHAPASQPSAARVDEEGFFPGFGPWVLGLGMCAQRKPVFQPRAQRRSSLLIEGDDALFSPLTHDSDDTVRKIDVLEIERDQLAQTNARRIKELQDGAVSTAERRRHVWSLQQLRYLVDG